MNSLHVVLICEKGEFKIVMLLQQSI